MDGIHDVGGKQGFGRVKPTTDELPFEYDWEGRMFGIFLAVTRSPVWSLVGNVDKFRFTREQLPPVEYLTRPYFDQWYRSLAAMFLGSGLVTANELATGRSAQTGPPLGKPMSAGDVAAARNKIWRFDREYRDAPRFAVGDRARASLIGKPGHTRLPQYVRGHSGVVVQFHGAHVVPDESAQGRPVPEPLYTVVFELAELFPEQIGSSDTVHLDLWERYLEPIK
jgi:nitrile hydratase subunit beta